ncbi:MAG TPA: PstS family phosphate ABC transporter substrate-binding protein [Geminicoccaceae bacterium]|nr:PstS family phosphate ABC transporter substrate-binding protein [Geminicoccaceae bacterium]
MKRWMSAIGVAGVGSIAACTVAAQDLIQIDGSSTVYPITEAMAEEFQAATGGKYRVTVGISGSGGGFKKFCRGETHISDASRPIKESERAACAEAGIEFIELPVALDALTVTVNPNNDWVDYLTVDELKKIWEPAAQGVIDNWSEVREGFPDRPLTLYGAGVDSGTYDYFTEAVVGQEGASRGDFTASEDDNVLVQGISTDPNALGFFGLAYYVENQNRLKAVPIQPPGGGDPVLPSLESARDGSYQPLSRPIFIYVSRQAADQREAVRQFVEFYLDPENAELLVEEVGYVPLPTEAYQLALRNFQERNTGTAFAGGSQVGVAVQDLLQAERVN